MSTLYDLDEFTLKVIGTFKKYQAQHPGDEVRTFETWINLFVAWIRYEDGGATSSSTENEYHPSWTPNGHSHEGEEGVLVGFIQEVQPQTGVKSSSDEPTISVSEKPRLPTGHWDEVPLDWKPQEASSAPWNDESWINPGWPVD